VRDAGPQGAEGAARPVADDDQASAALLGDPGRRGGRRALLHAQLGLVVEDLVVLHPERRRPPRCRRNR
jgi:hypothetical protein